MKKIIAMIGLLSLSFPTFAKPPGVSQLKLLSIKTSTEVMAANQTKITIHARAKGSLDQLLKRLDPQNWSKVSSWFIGSSCVNEYNMPLPQYAPNTDWECNFLEHVKFKTGIEVAETYNLLTMSSSSIPSENVIRRWSYKEIGDVITNHLLFGYMDKAITIDDGYLQIQSTNIEDEFEITLIKDIGYRSDKKIAQYTLNIFVHLIEPLVIEDMVKDMIGEAIE